MYRTQGTATDRKKFTVSMWVKIAKLGSEKTAYQFMDFYANGSDRISLYHNPTDYLQIYHEKANSGSNEVAWISDAIIRDKTAWYHFVWRADSTQATAADRFRVYINGQQITLNSTTYPTQNFEFAQGTSSYVQYIGRYGGNTNNNFEGVMSHVNFCDGYSYGPDSFGSTDAVTGIWKINTSPSVTYGNNGFFLKMEDSTNLDLDSSPNNHSFTTGGGTVTATLDNPSNNLCVLNPLPRSRMNTNNAGDYLINASTTLDTTSSNSMKAIVTGTIGAKPGTGKFYWEYKIIDTTRLSAGITMENIMTFPQPYYDETEYSAIMMNTNGTITGRYTGSAADEFGSGTSNTANDIIGVALDLDNKALYIHKNGTYISNGSNVGVPTSGSSRTGSLIEGLAGSRDDYLPDGEFIFPVAMDVSGTGGAKVEFNFGNGFFGTTQISSEGTNASNIGKFEYDVPAGYTALSTKGLNE